MASSTNTARSVPGGTVRATAPRLSCMRASIAVFQESAAMKLEGASHEADDGRQHDGRGGRGLRTSSRLRAYHALAGGGVNRAAGIIIARIDAGGMPRRRRSCACWSSLMEPSSLCVPSPPSPPLGRRLRGQMEMTWRHSRERNDAARVTVTSVPYSLSPTYDPCRACEFSLWRAIGSTSPLASAVRAGGLCGRRSFRRDSQSPACAPRIHKPRL